MIDLFKLLGDYLETIHPRVYSESAPDDALYPYIVFNFPNISDDGQGHQVAVVDIDGWDAPSDGDTTVLENLMKNINDNLNKKTLDTVDLTATFYLDRKLPLTDDDKRIKRRKYVYQGRLFEYSIG